MEEISRIYKVWFWSCLYFLRNRVFHSISEDIYKRQLEKFQYNFHVCNVRIILYKNPENIFFRVTFSNFLFVRFRRFFSLTQLASQELHPLLALTHWQRAPAVLLYPYICECVWVFVKRAGNADGSFQLFRLLAANELRCPPLQKLYILCFVQRTKCFALISSFSTFSATLCVWFTYSIHSTIVHYFCIYTLVLLLLFFWKKLIKLLCVVTNKKIVREFIYRF